METTWRGRMVPVVVAGLAGLASPALAQDDAPAPAAEEKDGLLGEWSGQIDFSLTGTSGNSEGNALRAFAQAIRDVDRHKTTLSAGASRQVADGEESENRAFVGARHDYSFTAERWKLFGELLLEYDEFQAWDLRLSGAIGPAYLIIDRENMELLGRAGYGFTYEEGGDNEGYENEGILGLDFEWDIDENQSLRATAEYRQSLEGADYRVITGASYEVILSEKSDLYLRLGFEDRYDSSPGGNNGRNDIDYFAALGWKF